MGAAGVLLALGAVGHVVVHLQVGVKLDRDIDVGDGETRCTLIARERSGLILADSVLDHLRSKCTASEVVTLAKRVGAAPAAGEVKVAIFEVLVAGLEIGPVETTLLLIAALVVVVLWGIKERTGEEIPGCSSLLGSKASDDKRICGLHLGSSLSGLS